MKSNRNEFGYVTMSADSELIAGSRVTCRLTYVCGSAGIEPGGGLYIFLPYTGFTSRWEAGLVTANSSAEGVSVTVDTENTAPISYHARKVPCIRVKLWGRALLDGEKIEIVIGQKGGFADGWKVTARVQDFTAKDARFRIFTDPRGGEYPRPFAMAEYMEELTDVPVFDIAPSVPVKLKVVLRGSLQGEENSCLAVISALDSFDNPVEDYEGTINVFAADGSAQPDIDKFEISSSDRGRKKLQLKFSAESAKRKLYCVDWKRQITGTSNLRIEDFDTGNIYFGDLHVMTAATSPITRGYFYGTVEGAYDFAENISGLDFTAVTDGKDAEDSSWQHNIKMSEKYNRDNEFATILAYENDMNCGHKNIFFETDTAERSKSDTAEHLWDFYRGQKILAIPHHPNVRAEIPKGGWGPHDFSTHNPECERLYEICQNRGSFETDEKTEGVEFYGYGSSAQDALSLGLKLGFAGGTDTHRSQPGAYNMPLSGRDCREKMWSGITAVYSEGLTRNKIYEALRRRECYATNGARILLKVTVNGAVMGSIIDAKETPSHQQKRVITVKAGGHSDISRIDIVRNNKDIYSLKCTEDTAEFEYTDNDKLDKIAAPEVRHKYRPDLKFRPFVFYYIRLVQEDLGMAWSSPVWFEL
ncbi:MAG: DUF3604 domain-containing protein [Planctomycetota bacterium]|jgi:hypothetical protein